MTNQDSMQIQVSDHRRNLSGPRRIITECRGLLQMSGQMVDGERIFIDPEMLTMIVSIITILVMKVPK